MMDQLSANSRAEGNGFVKSLAAATFVGVMISTCLAFLCLLFAGAGHGTNSPVIVCFGPVLAPFDVLGYNPSTRLSYPNLATFLLFGLYGFYGLALAIGRGVGHGGLTLGFVLFLHYAAVAACIVFNQWDGMRNLVPTSRAFGGIWLTVQLVVVFVAVHLLAVQYATSSIPYRARLSRREAIVLALGLVAGVLLHVAASAAVE